MLCLCLIVVSCRTSPEPPAPISMETLAELFTQAVILQASADSAAAQAALDSLFSAYGVTSRDVQATAAAYEREQQQWLLFWSLVTKKLEDQASGAVKTGSTAGKATRKAQRKE